MPNDTFQPVIALTGFKIKNTPSDVGNPASPIKQAINSLKEIILPYDQNFLTFEFAALEYNITEKIRYRYMLQRFDEKWIFSGNDNTANYTNIPPGSYTLKINATNTSGRWSRYMKSLDIVIQPPWWKTWWFIGLCIIAQADLPISSYSRG
jgi:hypothetical protein